jgi:hypothetical protein
MMHYPPDKASGDGLLTRSTKRHRPSRGLTVSFVTLTARRKAVAQSSPRPVASMVTSSPRSRKRWWALVSEPSLATPTRGLAVRAWPHRNDKRLRPRSKTVGSLLRGNLPR